MEKRIGRSSLHATQPTRFKSYAHQELMHRPQLVCYRKVASFKTHAIVRASRFYFRQAARFSGNLENRLETNYSRRSDIQLPHATRLSLKLLR